MEKFHVHVYHSDIAQSLPSQRIRRHDPRFARRMLESLKLPVLVSGVGPESQSPAQVRHHRFGEVKVWDSPTHVNVRLDPFHGSGK